MSRQVRVVRGKSNVNMRDDEPELPRACERPSARLQELDRRRPRPVDRERDLAVWMADVVLIMKRNQSASQGRLRSTWRGAGRGEIADGEVDPFRLTPVRVLTPDLGTKRRKDRIGFLLSITA